MNRFVLIILSLLLTSMYSWAAPLNQDAIVSQSDNKEAVFATVGNTVITRLEFEEAYQQARRNKFYHGKPTENEQETFRRKIADDLIDRKLFLQEAKRRGLVADEAKINATLNTYQQRYASSKRWQQDGSKMLASLGNKLREDDLLQELGKQIMQGKQPDAQQLKTFYENNLDKFTEPATQRVSLVLLKVDPSSSKETWDKTLSEASELESRLIKGEKFSAIATEYSDDLTAAKGGDMGYLHKGMLGQAAESAVELLSIGEVSSPVRVLEGIAIFRLDDRKKANVRLLSEVHDRAVALWQREKSETVWQELKIHLRNSTEIQINTKTPQSRA